MLTAKLYKIVKHSNTLDIEVAGNNILYTQNEIGKDKEGKTVFIEGTQIDDYDKKIEAEEICRNIADKLRKLNRLLES